MSEKQCGCRKCIKLRDLAKDFFFYKEEYQRMILCPTCGCKRCRADTYNKKARKTTGERNRNSDGTFAAH